MNDRDNNSFVVSGSEGAMKDFLKSAIASCDTVIEHYDFVLNDISSNISNPALEASKTPTISFLKAMKNEWLACKKRSELQLNELEANNKGAWKCD